MATAPAAAYRTNSKSGVKLCPRCKDPIVCGQEMTRWEDGPRVNVRGKQAMQWVHQECELAEEPVTVSSERQSVDLTGELKRLLDTVDFDQVDKEIVELIDSRLAEFRKEQNAASEKLAERVSDTVGNAAGAILDRAEAVAKRVVEELAPRRLEVVRPDLTICQIEGHVHPAFERVLKLASLRMNILLPGPAGCGKTHLARQVADALGLDFASVSCTAGMSEGQITGRLLPVGDGGKFEYVESDFVRLYERGGVFLLDEMDAADPNVLIVINSAIANGRLPLPNRPAASVAKRHPDFVLIAAANTFGRGADRLYCGRNELDEATLDRFRIGTVPMDYDEELEKQLCPDGGLRNRLQLYRTRCVQNRLERIVSSRFMRDGCLMLKAGWTVQDVEEQLFAGWSPDEVKKVRGS